MRALAAWCALALAALGGGASETALAGPLAEVGFEQRLGETLPVDGRFLDETGATISLAEIAAGRPILLAFVYYDCPMLCGMVIQGITRSLKTLDLEPGRDFEVVFVSFDPSEGPQQAAEREAQALELYGRPETAEGWHFLSGDDDAIGALTEAAGFRYAWVEETGEWAHAAGLLLLTPEGRVARVLYGVDYPPRDLRLAVVEAAEGGVGSLIDQVLLFCYHYDPVTGRYSFATMTAVRIGGILTLAGLGAFAFVSIRRERRSRSEGTT